MTKIFEQDGRFVALSRDGELVARSRTRKGVQRQLDGLNDPDWAGKHPLFELSRDRHVLRHG